MAKVGRERTVGFAARPTPGTYAPSIPDQFVSHRRFIDDQLRSRRNTLQLLAKTPYGDPQIIDLPFLRRSPNDAQQVGVGEDTAGMLGKLCQQGIFLGRQVNLLTIPPNRETEEVDRDAVRLHRLTVAVETEIGQVGDVALFREPGSRAWKPMR